MRKIQPVNLYSGSPHTFLSQKLISELLNVEGRKSLLHWVANLSSARV